MGNYYYIVCMQMHITAAVSTYEGISRTFSKYSMNNMAENCVDAQKAITKPQ